ncbi:MAG: hypothetical protein WCO60_20090 [Verrucomicrobiota bacterium]
MSQPQPLLQANLHIKILGQSKKDDTLTYQTIAFNDMAADSARVNKVLYAKALKEIKTEQSIARKAFGNFTHNVLGGISAVVAGEAEHLMALMNKSKALFMEHRNRFIERWPEILEQEKIEKGKAFRVTDYPMQSELAEKFEFQFTLLPLPVAELFKNGALGSEMQAQLAADFDKRIENTKKQVVRNTSTELLGLISEVAEVLGNKDKALVDSEHRKGAVAKLQVYLERVPLLNITNDPTLTAIYHEAKNRLDATTQQLREDEQLRQLQAATALNIAMKFGQMGNRKIAA